ncbi:NUDIX domain-containing protein [Streptomyces phaeoluteigriseus]
MTATGERVDRVDERDRAIGVVDRGEAVSNGRPHRVATTVRRDADGRILAHRRPETVSRFPRPETVPGSPGRYNRLLGGGAEAGESYERAAAREPAEDSARGHRRSGSRSRSCAGERSAPTGSASTKRSSPATSPPTRRRSTGTPGSPGASHTALGGRPPINRVNNAAGQYT